MVDINYEDVEDLGLAPDFFVDWFINVTQNEGKVLDEIALIFCSDDYLLEINQQHLGHDYYTDIVTFDYCWDNHVSGDLFISLDRVRENASDFGVGFQHELNRVIIHGVLHLCGYKDKSDEEELMMRKKENDALSIICST